MDKICLTLPTDRECAATIAAVAEEARYAAEHFDVEVCLLVLDSSDDQVFAAHAEVADAARGRPHVEVLHLDEVDQRRFLREVVDRAGVVEPDRVLDLMLPAELSYGACTNRAFLIAAALGCESVHRRDSDSGYQVLDGTSVFPVHHELSSLGRRAADAAECVTGTLLDQSHRDRPVVLVGGSFVGELSVDIGEIRRLDQDLYYDVVGLWAPVDWSEARKRRLVDESFTGSDSGAFTGDRSTLTIIDPMRVDMCNISFHQVHEDLPLPPAVDTIGSDYFLLHVVRHAALPGVEHNRDIVNFYTGERRTDAGFTAYQLRLAKFFLSMRYFHFVYDRMAEAGDDLLDERYRVRSSVVLDLVRESAGLDDRDNEERLDRLDRAYRTLGGRYAVVADVLSDRRRQLLDEARRDMEDFALLIAVWGRLVRAARTTSLTPVGRRS